MNGDGYLSNLYLDFLYVLDVMSEMLIEITLVEIIFRRKTMLAFASLFTSQFFYLLLLLL